MDPARWARIEEVFGRAVELPAADRTAFVAAECGDDGELCVEILSLLESESNAATRLRGIVDAAALPEPRVDRRPETRSKRWLLVLLASVVLAVIVTVAAGVGLVAAVGEAEGTELRAWRLDIAGGRQDVEVSLPNHLRDVVPPENVRYTLRTTVELRPDQQGRALGFTVDCFHSSLTVTIDGVALEDTGHGPGGSWRFVIPESATRDGTLQVAMFAQRESTRPIGFGVAPRISDTPLGDVRARRVAAVNHYSAIAALCFCVAFALLYFGVWIFERRTNEYFAMIFVALTSSGTPLLQLGLLHAAFGRFGGTVANALAIANFLATVCFLQIFFAVRRFRRRWYLVACCYLALLFASLGSFGMGSLLHGLVHMLITVAVNVYLVSVMVRALRKDEYRTDAWISVISFVPTFASLSQGMVWVTSGTSPMDGLHPLSITIILGTGAQALVLGRRHAARQRTIEQTSDELRRQVAERSRELADALGKLAQRPTAVLAEGNVVDGRYRILRSLGAGGMGMVYEVERIADGKRFALKTLRGRVDIGRMARFAREAQVAAELAHPNLVSVLDVGIADGSLYLVMELVVGVSLDREQARYGDPKWAVPLLRQIATGLAAMHARGIVHRDLKPANVLVAQGTARIADFGLASLHEGDTKVGAYDETTPHAPQLTRIGDVFGTPIYMGPELAAGTNTATPAADIFSFGVLACELLTGTRPFAEPPVEARLNGRALPPPRLAGIPEGLQPLIARCLDPDPEKRPTADDLVVGFAGAARLP